MIELFGDVSAITVLEAFSIPTEVVAGAAALLLFYGICEFVEKVKSV